ncbi:metallophosphoesterase [Sulfurimonas sp.]
MSKISRRTFLKSALAVTSMPLLANSLENKKETLKFIHVTDSHMDLNDSDSVEAMQLMAEFINTNYKDLDFVLFGGDNFNNNAPKDSDALKFKEIADTLHCPYYTVRGNKESFPNGDKQINLDEFKNMFCSSKDLHVEGKDWLLATKGYNILGLDSCIENHNNGAYTKETLRFAEKVLQQNKPTVILNHHPYTNYWGGTEEKDIHKYVLNNTKETQVRLFKYKNLLLTLSGHKHIDSVKELQGTKVIVTRGFIRPLDLDMYPMRYVVLEGNTINEKLIYTS